MATKEEVAEVISMLHQLHTPHRFSEKLDGVNRGIGSILRYLSMSEAPVSAGDISEKIGVSTARVAVLLQKMSAKNLVVTGSDPNDARRTLVSLSEYGKEQMNERMNKMNEAVAAVIDVLGMDGMKQFIQTLKQIKEIIISTVADEGCPPDSENAKRS